MAEFTSEDLAIQALGERTIDSPLDAYFREVGKTHAFYGDDARVLLDHNLGHNSSHVRERRGAALLRGRQARAERFSLNPRDTICAIVTCGGLCPGLNDVIRSSSCRPTIDTAFRAYWESPTASRA